MDPIYYNSLRVNNEKIFIKTLNDNLDAISSSLTTLASAYTISGVDATGLIDGSNADALHIHSHTNMQNIGVSSHTQLESKINSIDTEVQYVSGVVNVGQYPQLSLTRSNIVSGDLGNVTWFTDTNWDNALDDSMSTDTGELECIAGAQRYPYFYIDLGAIYDGKYEFIIGGRTTVSDSIYTAQVRCGYSSPAVFSKDISNSIELQGFYDTDTSNPSIIYTFKGDFIGQYIGLNLKGGAPSRTGYFRIIKINVYGNLYDTS